MAFNKQKAFGQNFLNDQAVISTIVERAIQALQRFPEASLLEIGPGKGALTLELLKHVLPSTRYYVAERDRDLVSEWKREPRLAGVIEGDFVQTAESTMQQTGKTVVVSNLPYSAGTAIVVLLSEMKSQVEEMILMFQSEVAKRIYSGPSTPDRGSLSLYIQNDWDIEKVLTVRPESFSPPPKVMSEVIRLVKRKAPWIALNSPEDRAAWNDLLKTAFRQRRKMLKGNFKATAWENAFLKSEIDPTKRAESLEWSDWVKLWKSR